MSELHHKHAPLRTGEGVFLQPSLPDNHHTGSDAGVAAA